MPPPRGATSPISRARIAAGENKEALDARRRTPLHVAVYRKQHDAARALIRLGADPNKLDIDRYDIITIAAVANDVPMLKIALEGGGNPKAVTSRYDGTALIAAAHLGHAEVVRTLIAARAPLDHVNNLQWTALIESIVLGDGGSNHTENLARAGGGRRQRQYSRWQRGDAAARSHEAAAHRDMVAILEKAGAR